MPLLNAILNGLGQANPLIGHLMGLAELAGPWVLAIVWGCAKLKAVGKWLE